MKLRIRERYECAVASLSRNAAWLGLSGIVAVAVSGACTVATEESVATKSQAYGSIMVAFQDGAYPTTSYAGTRDATIRLAASTSNYGASTTCTSDFGGGDDRSCMLRWDVNAIPMGSFVTHASITLRVTNGSSSVHTIHKLNVNWVESQVSWVYARSGFPWYMGGALSTYDRGPEVGRFTAAAGSITVPISVSLVQSWVDGNPNDGVIISTRSRDGMHFASSETSTWTHRPRLNVTYCDSIDCGGDSVTTTSTTGA